MNSCIILEEYINITVITYSVWVLGATISICVGGSRPRLDGCQNVLRAFCFVLHSQWLEEALRENEPNSCFVFLVGTKTDLLVSMFYTECIFSWFHAHIFLLLSNYVTLKPLEEKQRTEKDAVRIATEMHAEFWAVSAKTGNTNSVSATW